MKLFVPLFALLSLTHVAHLTTSQVLPIGRELSLSATALIVSNRDLQSVSCSQVNDAAEDVLEQLYGSKFSCSCDSGSTYKVTCNSNGQMCCGDICGTVRHVIEFTSTGLPVSEQSCLTYTSGTISLDGKTQCITGFYSGDSISSCNATIDGTACTSCSVCGALPGTSGMIEYMITDCANIAGGDLITAECEDLDTVQELQDWALQCGSSATMTTIATSILSMAAVSFFLLF